MSAGSTEPRAILEYIDRALHLELESSTKHGMAREIVERAGLAWLPTYESAGGTVTLGGLKAVHNAVELLTSGRTTDSDSPSDPPDDTIASETRGSAQR